MFKKKNVMIIGIQYLSDNIINVSYLLKDVLDIDEYKGLIPLSFKTEMTDLFSNFHDFGKWKKGVFNFDGNIVDLY